MNLDLEGRQTAKSKRADSLTLRFWRGRTASNGRLGRGISGRAVFHRIQPNPACTQAKARQKTHRAQKEVASAQANRRLAAKKFVFSFEAFELVSAGRLVFHLQAEFCFSRRT